MKDWLTKFEKFESRPIVFVEDRAEHVRELCVALKEEERYEGELSGRLTIVLLDRAGLDTDYFSGQLLLDFPHIQLVASAYQTSLRERFQRFELASSQKRKLDITSDLEELVSSHFPLKTSLSNRFMDLPANALVDEAGFVRVLDAIIRPGGMMICDVELSTLEFTKANVLLGVHAASTACRTQESLIKPMQKSARLVVVSNRDFFSINADEDLAEKGIFVAQKDILSKSKRLPDLVKKIAELVREQFAFRLRLRQGNGLSEILVGPNDQDVLDASLDLVMWPLSNDEYKITGGAIKNGKQIMEADSGRAQVLYLLIQTHLEGKLGATKKEVEDRQTEAGEEPYASKVRQGILRIFEDEIVGEKIVPKSKNQMYRLGDDAKVGLVVAK